MSKLEKLVPANRLMLINGELVASCDGRWKDTINPATGECIAQVPDGSAKDVENAVLAAEKAQVGWAALPVAKRSRYLLDLADAIAARSDELLALEVADTGNTITGMKGDVTNCVERLRYFASLGFELQGKTIPESDQKLQFTLREPYGVVGRIVAFNHPCSMAIHGVASPLMAGNAVILKPSDQTPLSACLFGEIASKVLPPGVLNVLTGGIEVGNALVRHPKVKKLSFVGSVNTGLAIQRSAAEVAVKSIALELGGKNPFILFPDAPLRKAAEAAVAGMNFTWQGQSCSSTSRLFVHDSVYDEVVDLVAEFTKDILPGDPFQWTTKMGAVISPEHLARIEQYVEIGKAEGARLVIGGKRPSGPAFERGNWYLPTVFADVTTDMRIAKEEIFGPILSIIRWSDLDHAIEMANSVQYGLTAAVWTNDINKALTTSKRLQSGYIWVNGINTGARGVPFGGYKNSGIGRERGLEELYSYTEEKSVQIFIS